MLAAYWRDSADVQLGLSVNPATGPTMWASGQWGRVTSLGGFAFVVAGLVAAICCSGGGSLG